MELFDIDKKLRALSAEPGPSEELRQQTRRMVSEAVRMKRRQAPRRRRLIYYPAAAAVLAIIMVVCVFPLAPAQAAGYYTIDINPSVSVAVDGGDNVISAEARNDDAKDLLTGLKLSGMRFEDALKAIIQTAAQKKYLRDDGHLLVAHFGSDEGISQQRLDEIVNVQLPETGVTALAINGGIVDYEKYEKAGKKAGIELLMEDARETGIEDEDIDKVIQSMSEKQGSPGDNDKKDSGGKGSGKDTKAEDNNSQSPDKDKEYKPVDGKDKTDKDKDEKDNVKDKNANGKDGKDNQAKDKDEKGGKKDKEEKEDKEK